MKYLFRKLAPLILLYAASAVIALGKFTGVPLYSFFRAFFGFATFVIAAGIAAHFLGEALPRNFAFEKKPLAPFSWENGGKIYAKTGIARWKDRTVDMGKADLGTQPKNLSSAGLGSMTAEGLERMIQETCVAGATHTALICLSPVILWICDLPWSVLLWAAYVISNLSDLMIQRYNRPRLVRLWKALKKRGSHS